MFFHLSSASNELRWKTVGSCRKPRNAYAVPMDVLEISKSELWKNEITMKTFVCTL